MTDCTCEVCVRACKQQPGWFAPGEAEKAAKLLGIPFGKFEAEFLVIDHCSDENAPDAPLVYAPKKIGVDPEGILSERTYRRKAQRGQCIFLKDDRCSIHAAKPFECRNVLACDWKHGTRDEVEALWIKAGAPLGMRPYHEGY